MHLLAPLDMHDRLPSVDRPVIRWMSVAATIDQLTWCKPLRTCKWRFDRPILALGRVPLTHLSPSKREVILSHVPLSLYSQVARRMLVVKGVASQQVIVMPGPPIYETDQPWSMRMNPMGTVPTLGVHGGAIDDSFRILLFVDNHFAGPRWRRATGPYAPGLCARLKWHIPFPSVSWRTDVAR